MDNYLAEKYQNFFKNDAYNINDKLISSKKRKFQNKINEKRMQNFTEINSYEIYIEDLDIPLEHKNFELKNLVKIFF